MTEGGAERSLEVLEVVVNGQRITVAAGMTVGGLVDLVVPSSRGVAVAIEREVVPRSTWSHVQLAGGEHVEIVSVSAGG